MGKKTSYCQLGLAIGFACAIAVGCGGSIAPAPTCKLGETPPIRQLGAIDKIDLLLAVDNSASMADKAELFSQAIPALVDALLTPACSNGTGKVKPSGTPGALTCPSGYAFEFVPVHDLHIGVVTSSLGGGGSPDVCDGSGSVPPGFVRHDDDHGRLISRTKPSGGGEGFVADAKPKDGNGGGFLAWLPTADPLNQGKPLPNVNVVPDAPSLTTDFQALVTGAQEFGCGLEAPLESWYRFLVQPDPWSEIPKASGGSSAVTLNGVDSLLLKERKDFLREDSLVAIVMLTDEEDSWTDPLALGGRGWVTRTQNFPSSQAKQQGTMPRPTSECLQPIDPNNPTKTGPNHPNCTSCGFAGNKADGPPIAADPQCQTSCGANCQGFYTTAEDGLNVRYTNDMKRRYGFNPQFPVERYVDGLKSTKVPNRAAEHTADPGGGYLGQKTCTNPLFARDLPDGSDISDATLCNLKRGSRTPDLVLFTVIGGVPWQLLAEDPSSDASALKSSLGASDWVKILGKDPATYQTDGIDPHMLESIVPRPGLPPPTAGNTADPIHGREWKTSLAAPGIDLQYACTFQLPTPKDCTLPANQTTCDCTGAAAGPEGSPLCNGTTQLRGKAYPTIRQLRVAKALGSQGMVSSLCAKNFVDPTKPNWALRPFVTRVQGLLSDTFDPSCYPTAHARGADGKIACKMMVALPGQSACDPSRGLGAANATDGDCFRAEVLTRLKEQNPDATAADVGAVCELAQLAPPYQNGTCAASAVPGWCYAVAADGGTQCPQLVLVSKGGRTPPGSYIELRCP